MKKIAALVILTTGLVCIIYSGFQIWKGRELQASALHQAKVMTKELGNSTQVNDIKKTKHVRITDKNIIGLLTIPRLEEDLPIVEGTSPDQLEKGVGHYETSALPGSNDQIVLSGHRDTVFQRFGELKKGDEVTVKLKNGSFPYIIDHMKIVAADDRTIIHSTKPREELVLTTCYPFHYVGNAPKRYIIYAYPKTS
ncbi:class D sortase [Bacillus sp. FJAT-49736]|uniref:class D sortase n=1 Tax=Bacillus sp. FJAT-49736 TaxID=2833582 RepID=UPI001BCA1358|nr:class D sortase [Bacillus sp. FJAT-49736]MBS4174011.1 class D sortase [Bacillus sp. FJAT-49736]